MLGQTPPRVKVRGPRRRGARTADNKPARLLAGYRDWILGHRKDTGAPCLLVVGDTASHYADLADCSCTRTRFLQRSLDRACSHVQAVRLWWQGLRTGRLTPHLRISLDDLAHFERQDLALANVADSLLLQYEGRTSQGRAWDVPVDLDGLAALVARDDADRARAHRAALVDPDGDPVVFSATPPDEH